MVRGHEATARRATAVARAQLLDPEESFQAAMDLWNVAGRNAMITEDRVRIREIAAARRAWAKIRARLG